MWRHNWKKCRRSKFHWASIHLHSGRNLKCLNFILESTEYPSSIAKSLPEPVSSSLTPVSTSLMQLCASLFPCNTRISLSLRKSWLYKCPLEIFRNVTEQNFGLLSIFSSEKKEKLNINIASNIKVFKTEFSSELIFSVWTISLVFNLIVTFGCILFWLEYEIKKIGWAFPVPPIT